MATQAKTKAKNAPHKPTTKAKTNTGNRWVMGGVLAVILLITYFLYAPVSDYGFTNWDDDVYVTENDIIGNPGNTKAMFTTAIGGNYHPLTMYSLAYDYAQTEGQPMEERAHRFHNVNLFFHLVNILLVFYFVYLFSGGRTMASYACALLFAIHPMHVESVAWVAERKDVLYTFFFFISLISYLYYLDKKKYLWLGLCLVAFVLSMASKPAAVILPLVLLAIDYFKERKLLDAKNIIEKAPFFILSLVAGILTVQAQKASGATDANVDYKLYERILFPFYGTMMYFIKLVLPVHLSAVYPFPNVMGRALGYEFFVAPLVVIAVVGALLYFGRKQRIVAFGLLFFFANVILILQFFSVGQAIIADRYTYVAYLGPFLILTWWLDDESFKSDKTKYYGLIALLVLLSVFSLVQTRERVGVWRDNETLWSDVIEKFPRRVSDAYNNRGYHYRHINQPEKALEDYAIAIAMNPTDEQVWSNRGNIYFDKQQFDSAIANYNRAVSYKSDLWETYSNRGASRAQVGDLNGAISDLEKATAHEPTISALTNLGLVYSMQGNHEKCIELFRRVLQQTPDAHGIVNAIGIEYQRMNKHAESIPEFSRAIQLSPNTGLYYKNRGISYNTIGNTDAALKDMETAQKLGVK